MARLGLVLHHHGYRAIEYEKEGVARLPLPEYRALGLEVPALTMPQEGFNIGKVLDDLWLEQSVNLRI